MMMIKRLLRPELLLVFPTLAASFWQAYFLYRNWQPKFGISIAELVSCLCFASIAGFWFKQLLFPPAFRLCPDDQGMIHHPWYGDYPAVIEIAVIPNQNGAALPSLMPGQMMSFVMILPTGNFVETPDKPNHWRN